ncbi:MAG: TonB-dependent receptor [Candidatus Didemnitutus sp.]|nr:TonB-dependent receptor [Candidatus Didemnitutus sp.]
MKTPPTPNPAAAALAALLLLVFPTYGFSQSETPEKIETEKSRSKVVSAAKAVKAEEEILQLEAFTVTTGYRSPKAIDQIPGAIKLITTAEIAGTQMLTDDATAVLSRIVPGYAPATQAMNNTGETLRGRVALRLFDGISQTTPLREGSRNGTFTDMDVVGRIEVINGPSASEGIGAVGGIINYISKSPEKEGSEAVLRSKFSGQGEDDSINWRVGFNYFHKAGNKDLVVGTSFSDRGISYDANGRRQGMSQSGSIHDSESQNIFIKAGYTFGENNEQRATLTVSRFHIEGKGNYVFEFGDRALGIPDSARRGKPLNAKTEFNDFNQYALAYNHANLLGGSLNVQIYKASQAMRFLTEDGSDRQDPLIAPLGTLVDQSEINSQKRGLRSSWFHKELFGVAGLEVNLGFDVLDETAQQKLALTDRVWVPPMNFTSKAPFVQASYTRGPVTVSGGVRREDGELQVDDYTTTYFRNRVFVRGGTLEYQETIPNAGLIVRLPSNWSVFASYSKGYTLPNVGIPLRNVNVPNKSVAGILDLQAVIADNKEAGVTWNGKKASLNASYYKSYSDFGVSLTVDPVTRDFVMQRRPVDLKGWEVSGEFRPNKLFRFNATYSHTKGMTRTTQTGPLTRQMGMASISPDKLNLSATWKFSDKGSMTLYQDNLFKRDINIGASGEEHTSGLTLHHLTVNYDTQWGYLSLGVENLTNKFYILPWSQIDQFLNYFAGRGRVVSLSHTLKF